MLPPGQTAFLLGGSLQLRARVAFIHTVQVNKEQIDAIAKQLNISDKDKSRIHPGDKVHIVREAQEKELNRNK